jgi:hypothetical protein
MLLQNLDTIMTYQKDIRHNLLLEINVLKTNATIIKWHTLHSSRVVNDRRK